MAQLEREGFVRSVPRRGIYVVRKTKREVIELITAWAALESMAARLITQKATDDQIAGLRQMFATFDQRRVARASRRIFRGQHRVPPDDHPLSGNSVLIELAENLFTHMRMIRRKTIGEKDRVDRSIRDHMNIIEALEARDTDARRGSGAQPRARPRRARGEIRRLSGLKHRDIGTSAPQPLATSLHRREMEQAAPWCNGAPHLRWEEVGVQRAPGERDRCNVIGEHMAEAAVKELRDATPAADAEREQTDGFHLVIDALKLNGLTTIYGVPGIPITDFGRMAQAAGIRVISFRHEQNAGYAASIAGFLTKKPGVCLTVSAPGLPQRPDRARPRHHQLLSDDPDLGLVRARDRRPAAGRLRGDGPARHRQAAVQGGLPRPACRRTSASVSRARSAPRSPAVRAASISTCRPSCSAR